MRCFLKFFAIGVPQAEGRWCVAAVRFLTEVFEARYESWNPQGLRSPARRWKVWSEKKETDWKSARSVFVQAS